MNNTHLKKSNIVLGYIKSANAEVFLSRAAAEKIFFDQLSKIVTIKIIPEKFLDFSRYTYDPPINYLWMDLSFWGIELFKQREMGKINVPFLCVLHIIHFQYFDITNMIPFLRNEDILIVGSQSAKKAFAKFSTRFAVHVIPFSFDIKHIRHLVSNQPKIKANKSIVYVGRIKKEKGLDLIINSLPYIIDKHPTLVLNIVGPLSGGLLNDIESEYFKSLQKKIKILGVDEHVNWHGLILSDKKYEIIAQADILLNPSLIPTETFGLVNIEALACGVPVICSNNDAFLEIILDGFNGQLLSSRLKSISELEIEQSELVNKICTLLSNESMLAELKKNASESAIRYHWENVIPILAKILITVPPLSGNWLSMKEKTLNDFQELYTSEWFNLLFNEKIWKELSLDQLSQMNAINNPIKISRDDLQRIFMG